MLVGFKASAVFTEPLKSGQTQHFPKHVKKKPGPFLQLSVIGGRDKWFFQGVLDIRPLKQKKRIAYEITAEIVRLVEELTHVGVDRIDFESIDPQVML